MKKLRSLLFVGLVLTLSGAINATSSRQESDKGPMLEVDSAFSNQLLPALGYPSLNLRETGTGLEGFPDKLAAGRYHVTLTAPESTAVHLLLVQYPKGLSQEQAEAGVVDSAANDVAHDGWVYAGGAYALPGMTITFLMDIKPGDWHVASTRESVRPSGGCGGSSKDGKVEEWATLQPIRVSAGALPAEPAVSASIELKDLTFSGLPETFSAGPQIWKFTTTGPEARNMLIFRTPRFLTADEVQQLFGAPRDQPPEGLPSFNDFLWAGDIALISPGHSTWVEFNLKPGTYLLSSWIVDRETGAPTVFLGMAQSITVQ